VGVIVGLVIVEIQLPLRNRPDARPVAPARRVEVVRAPRAAGPGHVLRLAGLATATPASAGEAAAALAPALLLDSGGAGRYVLFEHERHQADLGGRESCGRCHHRNAPLSSGTPCQRCHRDMYRTTDTFDHEAHATAHGGRASCAICHADPARPKTRAGAKACDDCHGAATPEATLVRVEGDREPGMAPGYAASLHGLCLECHRREDAARGAETPVLALCSNCHRPEYEGAAADGGRAGWSVSASLISARAAATGAGAVPEEGARLARRP
jgi:hypothetical protein